MIQSCFYETIFKRKSIRKYDFTPLDDKILSEIAAYIDSLEPLFGNIKVEIRIVKQDEVNTLFSIKAPYYLVMTSENKDGYLTNAGYMLQQLDLFFSSKGIGSCYLGMAQSKSPIKTTFLEFVMVFAFGKPDEAVHRKNVSEFKRKSLEQITDIKNYPEILEAVRVAPSATNSQPWYLTGGNGVIHIYCVKCGAIKALLYGKMNKIDIGIAICHLVVAAEYIGKKVKFVRDKDAKANPPKGYYYIVSANLKDK